MNTILAIDPGCTESGWCVIDAETHRPLRIGKTTNGDFGREVWCNGAIRFHHVAIEMVASYGMPVGAEVFETCVWIGRHYAAAQSRTGLDPSLVYRRDIKLHHCGSARAKDANITQALIDRFAHGQPNRGKGTKTEPGWFHGFKADIWQAYALAVYAADTAQEAVA